jgi:hypothetical protein
MHIVTRKELVRSALLDGVSKGHFRITHGSDLGTP